MSGHQVTNHPRELRERAVRVVAEVTPDHPSQWTAIIAVTSKWGYSPPTNRPVNSMPPSVR